MKAPDKLYITNDEKRFSDKCHSASTEKYVDDDIEYIRADAFIEKACAWFRTLDDKEPPYETTEEFIEGFKKAMKL